MINIDIDNNILETFNNLLQLDNKKVEKRFMLNLNTDFKITFVIMLHNKYDEKIASIYEYDYPNWNKVEKYILSFSFYTHSFLGKILSFDIDTIESHMILLSDREFNEVYSKTRLAYLKIRNKDDISSTLHTINDLFNEHNNIINSIDDL